MEEEESKKNILLQKNLSIAYASNGYFINDEEIKKEDGNSFLSKEAEKMAKDSCKMQFYDIFLKKHYKHIVVLSGAGTSLDNGNKSGKTRDALWIECQAEINAFESIITDLRNKNFYRKKDIEGLLSHIILLEKTDDAKKDELKPLHKALENKIKKACKLKLDTTAPHIDFLNKITARKNNDARVQLFTTNYDTLFEQAANKAGFVVIDGFSFTQPREFGGKWFDLDIVNREKTRLKQEESFISKVFHLYKLHGSLNWTSEKDKTIQKENSNNPLMIYPANEKYESSYEQPYFEMMSRFQQALRKEETLLVVIGFGFQDKHIKNVIVEAVEQNPSFQLLIVYYDGNDGISIKNAENLQEFFADKDALKVKRGVNIVFDTFKDFTEKYPENQTYYSRDKENETI
jgi:NAD-dependent SIR2 family protein deacetylase